MNKSIICIIFALMSISCSKIKKEDTPRNISNDKILDRNNTQHNIQFSAQDSTNINDSKTESPKHQEVNFSEELFSIRSILDDATIEMKISEELDNKIKSTNQRLKNYPQKLTDSLKFITKTYIDYQLSLCLDTKALYQSLLANGNTVFNLSERSNKLVDILIKTPLKADILKFVDSFSKLSDLLNKSRNVSKNSKQSNELFRNKLKQNQQIYTQSKRIYGLVYDSIF